MQLTDRTLIDALHHQADSNDRLSAKIDRNRRERIATIIAIGIVGVVLVVAIVVAGKLLTGVSDTVSKIRSVQVSNTQISSDNHQLLQEVQAVTNPDAQARAAASTAAVVTRIIVCVENHEDHARDARVPLDPSCPTVTIAAPKPVP